METGTHSILGYSVESFFGLVRSGELEPDDRVELLDGVIVAEPPQDPAHASAITRLHDAIRTAIGARAVIRVQQPFIAGPFSAPEPDIALVPGRHRDYDSRHPTTALLIVEVAATSLPQDRLTKQRIYAAAACPEYWILNLRDHCVEVFRQPDVDRRSYTERHVAYRGAAVDIVAVQGAEIRVDDILLSPECA
jgi:Uma2 family endonuclease